MNPTTNRHGSNVKIYNDFNIAFKKDEKCKTLGETKGRTFVVLTKKSGFIETAKFYLLNLFGQITTNWSEIQRNRDISKIISFELIPPNKNKLLKELEAKNVKIQSLNDTLRINTIYANAVQKKLSHLDPLFKLIEIPKIAEDVVVDKATQEWQPLTKNDPYYIYKQSKSEFSGKDFIDLGVDKKGCFHVLKKSSSLIEKIRFYALRLIGQLKTDWCSIQKWKIHYKAQVKVMTKQDVQANIDAKNLVITPLEAQVKGLEETITKLQESYKFLVPQPPQCEKLAGRRETGGLEMTTFINEKTTSEEFDQRCKHYPEYRLNKGGKNGWHALQAAAAEGNLPLIEHIVAIGGKELLHLGNQEKSSPLACAIEAEKPEHAYPAVKKLLELGANPNIGEGLRTPLYMAIEMEHPNEQVVEILLRHGGYVYPCPSAKGLKVLKKVQNQVEWPIKRTFLAGSLKHTPEECDLAKLPNEIMNIILNFYSDTIF